MYRKLSSDSSSSGRLADGGSKGFEGGTGAARERAGGVGLYGQKGSSTQSFAVLTSMGIYHGSLAVGSKVRMPVGRDYMSMCEMMRLI